MCLPLCCLLYTSKIDIHVILFAAAPEFMNIDNVIVKLIDNVNYFPLVKRLFIKQDGQRKTNNSQKQSENQAGDNKRKQGVDYPRKSRLNQDVYKRQLEARRKADRQGPY